MPPDSERETGTCLVCFTLVIGNYYSYRLISPEWESTLTDFSNLQKGWAASMASYFYNLQTREGIIRDPEGTDFPSPYLAREHGRLVARELMQHRESATRSWRLDVYDGEGTLCFDVLFVTVDESILCLPPELRRSVQDVCAKSAALIEVMHRTKLMMSQLRATIAQAECLSGSMKGDQSPARRSESECVVIPFRGCVEPIRR
jgi:hypothetical protein